MFFFFNDAATTEIYTLSLHYALPISANISMMFTEVPFLDRFARARAAGFEAVEFLFPYEHPAVEIDRKSTRLNSSHANISYAVFCLKKKTNTSLLSIPQYLLSPFFSP